MVHQYDPQVSTSQLHSPESNLLRRAHLYTEPASQFRQILTRIISRVCSKV